MKFKLPTFTLTVRDLTSEEYARQTDRQRDYFAVDIKKLAGRGKAGHSITLCVGGPVIMTQGHTWNEAAAARSAISFANAPYCADDPNERTWMEMHGEDLNNEAFCHRILGKELRQ